MLQLAQFRFSLIHLHFLQKMFGAGRKSLDGSRGVSVDDKDEAEAPQSHVGKSPHSPANRRKHRRLQSAADDKVAFHTSSHSGFMKFY